MKAEFWHERWEADHLGFHQAEVNPRLREFWPELDVPSAARVFVPLCGKSLDMAWLRAGGHPIVGVEISPIAVRDFFAEAGLETTTRSSLRSSFDSTADPGPESMGELVLSSGGGYDLYCGDFFALEPAQLTEVRAVYDRAALIALPPEMRARYAEHLSAILPEEVSILLITLEYDQARMSGPPHSVPPNEIERLFGARFEIETLWSSGPEEPAAPFPERGLDVWCETVFRLRPGGAG